MEKKKTSLPKSMIPLNAWNLTAIVVLIVIARLFYVQYQRSHPPGPGKAPEEMPAPRLPYESEILGAIAQSEKGQSDKAEKDLNGIIQKNASALALNARGVLYYGQKKYKQAAKDFDEAIRLDPRYADSYNNRATLRLIQGDRNAALSDLDKVIELSPQAPGQLSFAFYSRARLHLALKHNLQAQEDLERALKAAPPNWKDRARAQKDLGRLKAVQAK